MTRKRKLVDDSSAILMLEAVLLSQGRYGFFTATDWDEAVEMAVNEQADVVLMDMFMPLMRAVDACRPTRKAPPANGIPLILGATRGEA